MSKIQVKACLGLLLGAMAVIAMPRPSMAEQGGLFFDRRIHYDIYFSAGYDDAQVIKNVEILRLQDIGDKTFLVIRSAGFNLKDTEGFILYDSVTAILPGSDNYSIRVEGAEEKQIRF